MRNYKLMRDILLKVSKECAREEESLALSEMQEWIKGSLYSKEGLMAEIKRLTSEDLIDSVIVISEFSTLVEGKICCITPKGEEFLRLIENPEVWEICSSTLKNAGLDLSYPFLKEVCDEIVKRYVFSKIPIKNED
jgi:hypothetical protein